MREQHATRVVGGKVEWTGARDENGNLVEPTADDLARLGVEQYDTYKQRRKDDMERRAREKAERDRFERFKAEFVRTGGAPADARAAYTQMKRDEASDAARRADAQARGLQRTNTLGVI